MSDSKSETPISAFGTNQFTKGQWRLFSAIATALVLSLIFRAPDLASRWGTFWLTSFRGGLYMVYLYLVPPLILFFAASLYRGKRAFLIPTIWLMAFVLFQANWSEVSLLFDSGSEAGKNVAKYFFMHEWPHIVANLLCISLSAVLYSSLRRKQAVAENQTAEDQEPQISPLAFSSRQPTSEEWQQGYMILSGKKYYLRANGIDYVVCIFFPAVGFIVGAYASFKKGEERRGNAMMVVGGIMTFIVLFSIFAGKH